jgi:hypothetical protein
MTLGPVRVLSYATSINGENFVQCRVCEEDRTVIGTEADTYAARGGGYKVYFTQMSDEEYTALPTHNAACLTYAWQTNKQDLRWAR